MKAISVFAPFNPIFIIIYRVTFILLMEGRMKKTIIAVLIMAVLCACSRNPVTVEAETEKPSPQDASGATGGTGIMLGHYAARDFITGAIPDVDLDIIVQAGIRAPSARNLQPWHFTVVKNLTLAQKMVPQAVDGNVLIVISAKGDGKTNAVEILDCALATQNIYLAAQALGYGSRIYTGPIGALNSNLKEELDLPDGFSAIALVRIGKVDGKTDAVSAASARKAPVEIVNYK
jgi:nitroreductase